MRHVDHTRCCHPFLFTKKAQSEIKIFTKVKETFQQKALWSYLRGQGLRSLPKSGVDINNKMKPLSAHPGIEKYPMVNKLDQNVNHQI